MAIASLKLPRTTVWGIVAEELREWEEARRNYREALEIFIQCGDRLSQAKTYHNLGVVAEELEEFSEAKANYLQGLQNFAEFNDTYRIQTFSIPALYRLYNKTQDETIIASIASILGVTEEKVKAGFSP